MLGQPVLASVLIYQACLKSTEYFWKSGDVSVKDVPKTRSSKTWEESWLLDRAYSILNLY